jgi:hypothetical protein
VRAARKSVPAPYLSFQSTACQVHEVNVVGAALSLRPVLGQAVDKINDGFTNRTPLRFGETLLAKPSFILVHHLRDYPAKAEIT